MLRGDSFLSDGHELHYFNAKNIFLCIAKHEGQLGPRYGKMLTLFSPLYSCLFYTLNKFAFDVIE